MQSVDRETFHFHKKKNQKEEGKENQEAQRTPDQS